MSGYDTILLGSSANALTAAAYLAKAGQRVLVLEQSAQLGGATATAEFADGFRVRKTALQSQLGKLLEVVLVSGWLDGVPAPPPSSSPSARPSDYS